MKRQNQSNQNDRGRRGGTAQDPEREARGIPSTEWDDRDQFPRRAAEPWPDLDRDYEASRRTYGDMGRRGYGQSHGSPIGGETRGWEDQGQREMRRREEYVGKGPKGYTRSDERIKEAVSDRLSEGYLDASEIEVTVKNGEVTLVGFVPDKNSRRWAEDLVDSVPGVKDVENRLKVKRSKPS